MKCEYKQVVGGSYSLMTWKKGVPPVTHPSSVPSNPRRTRCPQRATVEVDGKHYCRVHGKIMEAHNASVETAIRPE